ncbi:DUF1275 domain-containing protein [Candidatus Poribacteria bacterium]|nr:DUF1275 domain-containing protein [Candidatus Poribacteria bacterium]
MMFSQENRTLKDDMKLGLIFGFIGGYCNAVAITTLMFEICPMSANWGGLVKELGNLNYIKIFTYIPLILSFISGSYIGVSWIKKHTPTSMTIIEALLLISISFISQKNVMLAVAIGGFAIGMQNGMTSFISHHAVRTSHLTSTVTDIGINLARMDFKKVLVLSSKTFIYIFGAVIGVILVKMFGNFAFAIGGMYLILFIAIRFVFKKFHIQIPRIN